ncbi:MAG: tol-pal system YbgF family protein [Cyclobacteriaceae bacterium]
MLNINEENKIEILEQYLQGELSEFDTQYVEKKISEDANLQQDVQIIRLAQDAVHSSSIQQRVKQWHTKYRPLTVPEKAPESVSESHSNQTPVIPLWTRIARIAAVVLIGGLSYLFIQLAAENTDDWYDNHYVEYKLPVARDAGSESSLIDSLYLVKDYGQLTQQFEKMSNPDLQDQFLAAMSYMQQANFEQAVHQFESIRQENHNRNESVFAQETDYYQALALIEIGDFNKAEEVLQKVIQEPNHIFRQNISSIDLWKLKMLKWKN